MLSIFASAAVMAVVAPVHSADINHASTAYRTSYETVSTVHVQQVEPRFASRPTTPVCRWQAELGVNRSVTAEGNAIAAMGKAIHRFAPLSGSYAGNCASARSQIDAEIGRYAQARAGEALAAAQGDSAVVQGELDGLRSLSVKGG